MSPRAITPLLLLTLACASSKRDNGDQDACVGSCQPSMCAARGLPPTTITGTVFAPNGTLPLHGVDVYVPLADPGDAVAGVQCQRCSDGLPGGAVVNTSSDAQGEFTLYDAPAGDIEVIVSVGKWRKRIPVTVTECAENPLSAADTTLPRRRSEGDMPLIAISTGDLDALECLVRKLGIADEEITSDAQGGRVHLFSDAGSGGEGTDRFAINFTGGSGSFGDAAGLWSNASKLDDYDIVMLSCEGLQYASTKPQVAMDNMKAYADGGGRIYLSHWHNIWIEGSTTNPSFTQAPAVWPTVATFSDVEELLSSTIGTIDEDSHENGSVFADWMVNVGGSTTRGQIPISGGRNTCSSVDETKAEPWVYLDPATAGGEVGVQMFQFTTPVEGPAEERCGKVVFTDMHVSSDSQSNPGGNGYPVLCSTEPLTPQEKALSFMFFEMSSCVGPVL